MMKEILTIEYQDIWKQKYVWFINFLIPSLWILPFYFLAQSLGRLDCFQYLFISILIWANIRGIIFFVGLTFARRNHTSRTELLRFVFIRTALHFPLQIITNIITFFVFYIIFFKNYGFKLYEPIHVIVIYITILILSYLLAMLINLTLWNYKKHSRIFCLIETYLPIFSSVYCPIDLIPLNIRWIFKGLFYSSAIKLIASNFLYHQNYQVSYFILILNGICSVFSIVLFVFLYRNYITKYAGKSKFTNTNAIISYLLKLYFCIVLYLDINLSDYRFKYFLIASCVYMFIYLAGTDFSKMYMKNSKINIISIKKAVLKKEYLLLLVLLILSIYSFSIQQITVIIVLIVLMCITLLILSCACFQFLSKYANKALYVSCHFLILYAFGAFFYIPNRSGLNELVFLWNPAYVFNKSIINIINGTIHMKYYVLLSLLYFIFSIIIIINKKFMRRTV